MPTREKIREGIAHWLSDYYFRRIKFENKCSTKGEFDSTVGEFQGNEAEKFQRYLHSQGVVIKVKRGGLKAGESYMSHFVEPLIEE